ncbi:predicted protein, partial [Nematostella vectensis]
WAASTNTGAGDYLEVDLGAVFLLAGIATQGHPSENEFTRSYKLLMSLGGQQWETYKENNTDKIFNGNTDKTTVVKRTFSIVTAARYVRVNPMTFQGYKQMRVELYGCRQVPCHRKSVGLETKAIPDSFITASSQMNFTTPPSRGRLNLVAGAWCASPSDVIPYLQVDLGLRHVICALATQGSPSADHWVRSFQLHFTYDAITWRPYISRDLIITFDGNTNRNEIVRHQLSSAVYARFVRVIPTAYSGHKIVRMELYGVLQECNEPLGLEDKGVVNEKMTSSSKLNNSYSASAGRLYGGSSWCSATSSQAEYLQVDLGRVTRVTGIATQGSPTKDKWVTLYSVKHSDDGQFFTEYTAGESSKKVFTGNIDGSGVVVNWLMYPMTARYYRIKPEEWNVAICLRFDLYGCRGESLRKGANVLTRILNNAHVVIYNVATLSSSQNTSMTPPSLGKLHFPTGSWCAAPSDVTPYLQVDLGSRHVICAVATQGSPTADHWVQTYKIQASLDRSSWRNYSESGNEMNFTGNSDQNMVKKHSFAHMTSVRFIRFYPDTYHTMKQMRVELYG